MWVGIFAGASYFGLVFTLGFLMGTARTLVLPEDTNRLLGVLIELTIMLSVSWLVCRHLVSRFAVPTVVAARATMGGVALALLLFAEAVAGILLFGRTPLEQFLLYREASYALGLAAQLVFAAMPLFMSWREQDRR